MAATFYQPKEPKVCFFLTLMEVNATCICRRNHSQVNQVRTYQLVKSLVLPELGVSIVGLVLTLCGLAVALNIVGQQRAEEKKTRRWDNQCYTSVSAAGTAWQISLLCAYNIIRLVAVVVAGVYTVLDDRTATQKICNYLWLLGTWGAGLTTLDLSIGWCVQQWRPGLLHLYSAFPITAIRSVGLLIVGFALHGKAIIHAAVTRSPHCDEGRYWWGYERNHSLFVMPIVHYVLPTLLLSIITLVRVILAVQRRLWNKANHHTLATFCGNTHPECFVLMVSLWFSVSHLLATVTFITIMVQSGSGDLPNRTVYITQRCAIASELLCVVNACTTVIFSLSWPRFLEEMISILGYSSGRTASRTISRSTSSVPRPRVSQGRDSWIGYGSTHNR